MKILIVGDIHCKKASLGVVSDVLDKCRKIATKCDLTVFLGDVNDTKANIRSETIRLLTKKLAHWPTKLVIMIGNHDYDNAIECQGHSLEFLKELRELEAYSNIVIADSPYWLTLNDTNNTDDPRALFIPYYPEERFLKEYDTARKDRFVSDLYKEPQLLFLHQDMDACKYSNGRPVDSQISAGAFTHHKRVFVGHIHVPQQFDNVMYVGTPYTESFKESDESKRVIVYDTNMDKILEIPLGARQHVTFEYTINMMSDLKDVKRDLKKRIKSSHIVRVKINVPEEIESKIKKSLFTGFNVSSLKTIKIATTERVVMVTDNMSNVETMEVYLGQLDLDAKLLKPILKLNKAILGGIDDYEFQKTGHTG